MKESRPRCDLLPLFFCLYKLINCIGCRGYKKRCYCKKWLGFSKPLNWFLIENGLTDLTYFKLQPKMHVPKSLDFSSWSIFDEKISNQVSYFKLFEFSCLRKWIRRSATKCCWRGLGLPRLFSTYPLSTTRVSTNPKMLETSKNEKSPSWPYFT